MSRCPAGHESAATDYCDVCGLVMPLPGTAASEPPQAARLPEPAAADGSGGEPPCPNCGAPNPPDALFCEVCGYDHTTGAMPLRAAPRSGAASASPTPALARLWVAELWVDPQWYAGQSSPDPLPSAGPPRVVGLRHTSLLVGRFSQSRNIHPDIDCGTDSGVSRRHAQLTTDGSRWWVEDLDSANGTFVGDAVGDLPTRPIPPGQKTEVGPDDRVYLGSWTRLVIREALEGEVTG